MVLTSETPYQEWTARNGPRSICLEKVTEADVDWSREIMFVPFSASSWPLYGLGEELGYCVLSPNYEMPHADGCEMLVTLYGDEGAVGYIKSVRVTRLDGREQLHEQDEIGGIFNPELGSEAAPGDGVVTVVERIEVELVVQRKDFPDEHYVREADFFLFDSPGGGCSPFCLREKPSEQFIGAEGLAELFLCAYPVDPFAEEDPVPNVVSAETLRRFHAAKTLVAVEIALGDLKPERDLPASRGLRLALSAMDLEPFDG